MQAWLIMHKPYNYYSNVNILERGQYEYCLKVMRSEERAREEVARLNKEVFKEYPEFKTFESFLRAFGIFRTISSRPKLEEFALLVEQSGGKLEGVIGHDLKATFPPLEKLSNRDCHRLMEMFNLECYFYSAIPFED